MFSHVENPLESFKSFFFVFLFQLFRIGFAANYWFYYTNLICSYLLIILHQFNRLFCIYQYHWEIMFFFQLHACSGVDPGCKLGDNLKKKLHRLSNSGDTACRTAAQAPKVPAGKVRKKKSASSLRGGGRINWRSLPGKFLKTRAKPLWLQIFFGVRSQWIKTGKICL